MDKEKLRDVLHEMGYEVEFNSENPCYCDVEDNCTDWEDMPIVLDKDFLQKK